MSETYRGIVVAADSRGITVRIPSLGDGEYGPLESLTERRDGDPLFQPEDRVLVQQVSKVAEDFMVLGFIKRYVEAP